jgi:GT2 family glycosyltransferase
MSADTEPAPPAGVDSAVTNAATGVGLVVIGRNEGERLRRCLESLHLAGCPLVYVDSASTDGSVELAGSLGAHIVALDASEPFTAARARNAGFARLLALAPQFEFVQFVDGDCEMFPGWLDTAAALLRQRPEIGIVAGRVRERHPEASVYNRLCAMEWERPAGESRYCGGIALFRRAAFDAAGGFNPGIIAGEEPEFCIRVRRRGWRIWRLAEDMVWHDTAMLRFGQWWQRSVRAGHAYAEGAARHGRPPERHFVRETRSILFWCGVLPLAALGAVWSTGGLGLLLLLCYPVLACRIVRRQRAAGRTAADAWLYAGFVVLGKLPQFVGVLQYTLNRLRGRRTRLMEYKDAPGARRTSRTSEGDDPRPARRDHATAAPIESVSRTHP